MRQGVQEWCATAVECLEIPRFIVWRAILPTPREDADPWESQGTHGRLVRLALSALLLVVDLGPEGRSGGCRRPLHKRLAQKLGTRETPVAPGRLAAAFGHGRHPRIFVACLGRSVALSLVTTGHQETRGEDGTGAWQSLKQGEIGMLLGPWRDGVVAVSHDLQGDAELGHERVHEQGVGGDDAVIRGQGHSALDGLDAGGDHVGRVPVGGSEEALKGGAPGALDRFECRPAAQDVAKERGILILKPPQDVGTRVFQGTGQAVGAPHLVADQTPTIFDELCQGAHRRALGAEGGELGTGFEENLDLECGSGGGVFRPTRGQRFAILGHGERMDGKEPEDILVPFQG